MKELLLLKSDLVGAYGIEMLETFDFEEDLLVNLISTMIFAFSALLDEGQSKEQFQAEVLKRLTEELTSGTLETTLKMWGPKKGS